MFTSNNDKTVDEPLVGMIMMMMKMNQNMFKI